jgi:hypothetical protein
MKRFVVREVETLKTTAAMYGLICPEGCCFDDFGWYCCGDVQ